MTVERLAFSSPGALAGPEEAARLRRWWGEFFSTSGGLEVTADPEAPFAARVDLVHLGDIGLGRSCGSIDRFYRGPRGTTRDGVDRFQLVINRGETTTLGVGRGWRKDIPPGSAILFDYTEHAENVCPGGHCVTGVRLPRMPLLRAMRGAEDHIGSLIRGENEALRLLVSFADGISGSRGVCRDPRSSNMPRRRFWTLRSSRSARITTTRKWRSRGACARPGSTPCYG